MSEGSGYRSANLFGLGNFDMRVPFNDLKRATVEHRSLIQSAIDRVLSSGWFVLGPENEMLESELASYVGVKHSIGVANGTDAIELALASLGVDRGDLVVTVANAGAYTTTATLLLGAIPVYCDVDPETLLMSAQTLESALAICPEKPKAIVVTHLYGAMAPMEELIRVARASGIPVVEDCAQSLGSIQDGKQSGSLGDIATTSFYPTKNLGALGDGGAVFTNDDHLADAVRRMRQYGWKTKYSIQREHGKNSRLDEIQAAIIRNKLPLLDRMNEKRRQIHLEYESASSTEPLFVNSGNSMAFIGHLAVVKTDQRNQLSEYFGSLGISTDIHYPIPDHRQLIPGFEPISGVLDVTEAACAQVMSLPLFPELEEPEVAFIVSALENI